ncbi:MAG: hypothetical protein V4487_02675 [Chlamydiota bacterium]
MSNISIPTQPPQNYAVNPPASGNNDSPPIYLQSASVGFIALLMAMLANSDSVQNFISKGLMPLSEMVSTTTENYSTAWLGKMDGDGTNGALKPYVKGANTPWDELSDMGKIDADAAGETDAEHAGDPSTSTAAAQSAGIQADTTQFNADNTYYNQATTFFSGISSGLNDNLSHTNDQVSFDYQQIQYNTFATQTTLVSVL